MKMPFDLKKTDGLNGRAGKHPPLPGGNLLQRYSRAVDLERRGRIFRAAQLYASVAFSAKSWAKVILYLGFGVISLLFLWLGLALAGFMVPLLFLGLFLVPLSQAERAAVQLSHLGLARTHIYRGARPLALKGLHRGYRHRTRHLGSLINAIKFIYPGYRRQALHQLELARKHGFFGVAAGFYHDNLELTRRLLDHVERHPEVVLPLRTEPAYRGGVEGISGPSGSLAQSANATRSLVGEFERPSHGELNLHAQSNTDDSVDGRFKRAMLLETQGDHQSAGELYRRLAGKPRGMRWFVGLTLPLMLLLWEPLLWIFLVSCYLYSLVIVLMIRDPEARLVRLLAPLGVARCQLYQGQRSAALALLYRSYRPRYRFLRPLYNATISTYPGYQAQASEFLEEARQARLPFGNAIHYRLTRELTADILERLAGPSASTVVEHTVVEDLMVQQATAGTTTPEPVSPPVEPRTAVMISCPPSFEPESNHDRIPARLQETDCDHHHLDDMLGRARVQAAQVTSLPVLTETREELSGDGPTRQTADPAQPTVELEPQAAQVVMEGTTGRPDERYYHEGSRDEGTPDGGTPDGGTPDGGTPDGGTLDGGTPDGGTLDGATPDERPQTEAFQDEGTRYEWPRTATSPDEGTPDEWSQTEAFQDEGTRYEWPRTATSPDEGTPDEWSRPGVSPSGGVPGVRSPTEPLSAESRLGYRAGKLRYQVTLANRSHQPLLQVRVVPDLRDQPCRCVPAERVLDLLEGDAPVLLEFELRPAHEVIQVRASCDLTYLSSATGRPGLLRLKPLSSSISWPRLRSQPMSREQWGVCARELKMAQLTLDDMPLAPEMLLELATQVVEELNLYRLKPRLLEAANFFRGTHLCVGRDEQDRPCGIQVEAVGGLKRNRLLVRLFAPSEPILAGLHHRVQHELKLRLELVEQAGDRGFCQVQGDIVKGSKTEVHDSVVSRWASEMPIPSEL